jgi:NAD(P)-dependent dehydrogenase (short-subunit alcohol dehydrogenase family)
MRNLQDKVAVVTGGTYGVGRGVAVALARQGAQVFVTGRSVQDGAIDGDDDVTGIRCDHRNDEDVTAVFERVARATHGVDILVNNVWGGYERMVEDGALTWAQPFWEQPLWVGMGCSRPAPEPTTTRAGWPRRQWSPGGVG